MFSTKNLGLRPDQKLAMHELLTRRAIKSTPLSAMTSLPEFQRCEHVCIFLVLMIHTKKSSFQNTYYRLAFFDFS